MGCYSMAVITALTAQNTTGVRSVRSVSDFLKIQLDTVLDDILPDAVKIGVLPDERSVEVVSDAISSYSLKNVVVDPVIISTAGDALTSPGVVDAMCRLLLPKALLVTPNIMETYRLSGLNVADIAEAEIAARVIADNFNIPSVLVKGGHIPRQADLLFERECNVISIFDGEYIDTVNTHGTGCTLSSAIACGLALGKYLSEAVDHAKQFMANSIKEGASFHLGSGHGPVNHLYNIIKNPIRWK